MSKDRKVQNRIIRDPNNLEETRVPEMPLLVALDNGTIGEASSLSSAAALIIGSKYFDAEDEIDEYAYRLESARKEIMRAIGKEINARVYDRAVGVIQENYAADAADPDYEQENKPPIYVQIRSEKLFLLSLIKIDAISIYEREDSFLLRPGESTEVKNYTGGTYIDLDQEYNIDELIAAEEHEIYK